MAQSGQISLLQLICLASCLASVTIAAGSSSSITKEITLDNKVRGDKNVLEHDASSGNGLTNLKLDIVSLAPDDFGTHETKKSEESPLEGRSAPDTPGINFEAKSLLPDSRNINTDFGKTQIPYRIPDKRKYRPNRSTRPNHESSSRSGSNEGMTFHSAVSELYKRGPGRFGAIPTSARPSTWGQLGKPRPAGPSFHSPLSTGRGLSMAEDIYKRDSLDQPAADADELLIGRAGDSESPLLQRQAMHGLYPRRWGVGSERLNAPRPNNYITTQASNTGLLYKKDVASIEDSGLGSLSKRRAQQEPAQPNRSRFRASKADTRLQDTDAIWKREIKISTPLQVRGLNRFRSSRRPHTKSKGPMNWSQVHNTEPAIEAAQGSVSAMSFTSEVYRRDEEDNSQKDGTSMKEALLMLAYLDAIDSPSSSSTDKDSAAADSANSETSASASASASEPDTSSMLKLLSKLMSTQKSTESQTGDQETQHDNVDTQLSTTDKDETNLHDLARTVQAMMNGKIKQKSEQKPRLDRRVAPASTVAKPKPKPNPKPNRPTIGYGSSAKGPGAQQLVSYKWDSEADIW